MFAEYSKVRESVMEAREQILRCYDAPGRKILDAGAGRRKSRLQYARLIPLDIDGGPECIKGDIQRLPFENNTFDLVVCTQVLEHVENPFVVCRELHRVLKPSGIILVTVPFVWREHPHPIDYWRFSRDGCRYLLTQAGFSDIEIRSNGGYFEVLNYVLAKLGARLLGRHLGAAYNLFYKPVGAMFFYLDKLFPHPDFSINNSGYGRKL